LWNGGIIANLPAFLHFILDWAIWKRAPLAVQKELLETLINLVQNTEHSEFNIRRLRQIDTVALLLDICKDHALPLDLGPSFIAVLKALIGDKPSKSHVLAIFNHLLTTHQIPQNIAFKDSGTPVRAQVVTEDVPSFRAFIFMLLLGNAPSPNSPLLSFFFFPFLNC
jgi:hypothetical protein